MKEKIRDKAYRIAEERDERKKKYQNRIKVGKKQQKKKRQERECIQEGKEKKKKMTKGKRKIKLARTKRI